jgi:hypothetical protein
VRPTVVTTRLRTAAGSSFSGMPMPGMLLDKRAFGRATGISKALGETVRLRTVVNP